METIKFEFDKKDELKILSFLNQEGIKYKNEVEGEILNNSLNIK